ncbi:polyphenol oxidase family protein [Luteococcus sp. Sow4_B9]|uniref:polyphenol oxidase family protein n=1 Tax=Luteococcus sp. Sow4_B9 TaxID=3438792 RepID=UPI003F98AD51
MFSYLERPGASGTGLAFTDRHGGHSAGTMGSLNLGRTDVDDLAALRRNGRAVLDELGIETMVTLNQVHGADVLLVDEDFLTHRWGPEHWLGEPAGVPPLPVADAMVTTQAGVALAIRVADCVPVLLADRRRGVLGAAHAGRVGFDQGVLIATLDVMRSVGASEVEAWIGPHVCGQCYEVPQDMADEVESRHPGSRARTSWGTPSLDLGEGCQRQLEQAGVSVNRHDPCTLTSPDLHSHRRDGRGAGRQVGIIWRVS